MKFLVYERKRSVDKRKIGINTQLLRKKGAIMVDLKVMS